MTEIQANQPDPSWDYASLWEKLLLSQEQFSRLIAYIRELETATDDSHNYIAEELSDISEGLTKISLDYLGIYHVDPGSEEIPNTDEEGYVIM